MRYRLAETVVTVAGTIEFVRDKYDESREMRKPGPAAATITIGLRADPTREAEREVVIGRGGADDDFTIALSDGRLSEVSYKSVGVGGKVVAAGVKVVAFVGGIAARLLPMFLGAEGKTPRDPMASRKAEQSRRDKAEKRARQAWNGQHRAAADLYQTYTATIETASTSLATARNNAAIATDPAVGSAALALAARIEDVISQSQREVDRIDTLYRAWRGTTQVARIEAHSYELSLTDLPTTTGDPPAIEDLSDPAVAAWTSLGLIVGVAANPDSSSATVVNDGHLPEKNEVAWRIPRLVRFWVWRRDQIDAPVLDRTFAASVVDDKCHIGILELNSSLFGEQSGTITFGDLGAPTKLIRADKSVIGAVAEALAGVPESVTAGLDAAVKSQASVTGLLDADDERRLASVKRRVDQLNKELEEKGLNATAEHFAEQKRLEQQVAIIEAQGKLEPSELAVMQEQLELVETRTKLQAARQKARLDVELATVRAEIARLEDRVRLEELRAK